MCQRIKYEFLKLVDMKKNYLLTLSLLFVASYSLACTNFIVGKGASINGSVICTYNADDYGMFIGLDHYPAGTHKMGEMRQVYDWDSKVYRGQIP